MKHVLESEFINYIDSYKSIQILSNNGIMDEEEKAVYEHNLLHDIIATMKTEIGDF